MTKAIEAKTSRPLNTIDELAAARLIAPAQAPALQKVADLYAVSLTHDVVSLINRDDPRDPIARQFVPSEAELITQPEEHDDPIGDEAFSPVDGIVHRYEDRVLLKLLHVCPVYCRFCFRRAQVGPAGETHLSPEALDKAFAYIGERPAIWEVILTGGDPLTLSDRRLEDIMQRLTTIPHVKILRIHTRIPCVDPSRITQQLAALLKASGKTVYVVLHANHARELTARAREACALLIDNGIPMLSQSVLLRGINDTAESLSTLLRTFVENRIKPYYLHQLDPAPGTSHFRVPIEEGQALLRDLQGRVSGLCLPRYMLDIPGGFGKVPVGPGYLEQAGSTLNITDPQGKPHLYPTARSKPT